MKILKWEELPKGVRKKFIGKGMTLDLLKKRKYYRAEDGEYRMQL